MSLTNIINSIANNSLTIGITVVIIFIAYQYWIKPKLLKNKKYQSVYKYSAKKSPVKFDSMPYRYETDFVNSKINGVGF